MLVIESIAALIVTISILVTIHEMGHFLVARLFNVKVIRFSVGFGKPVFSFYGKPPNPVPAPAGDEIQTRTNEPEQGTEFAIAAIPLGGYVKMLDEREGYVADDELHLAFNRKPVLQRIAIVLAGPLANFLLAILAYWILFSTGVTGIVPVLGVITEGSKAEVAGLKRGQEIISVDGQETPTWSHVNLALFDRLGDSGEVSFRVRSPNQNNLAQHKIEINNWLAGVDTPRPTSDLGLNLNYPPTPPLIKNVSSGKRAEKAGLQAGDRILAVDGESITDWAQWVKIIQASAERSLNVRIQRHQQGNSQEFDLQLTPERVQRDGIEIGFIGAAPLPVSIQEDMIRKTRHPFYTAWIPAIRKTWSVTEFTLVSVKKMVVGVISHKNLSGPITIAQLAGETANSGLESFIGFIALLSISLGVLNLLPIPVLDGGHLLYYLIEIVIRRPVPEKIQLWGLQIGLFLIVSIMLLASYNDIARLGG